MSLARIVELSGGLATGLLGIIVAVTIFKDDFDTSRQLEQEFHPVAGVMVYLIVFVVPALLVVVGAYFHSVLRDSGPGRVMIFSGAHSLWGSFYYLRSTLVTQLCIESVCVSGRFYHRLLPHSRHSLCVGSRDDCSTHNKSLDRSGGSVFRIKLGAAKVVW
jgi:hypothetical protein